MGTAVLVVEPAGLGAGTQAEPAPRSADRPLPSGSDGVLGAREAGRAGRDPSAPAGELREAVAALPPLRRRVLELRDVEGWTRTAVSRELDISEDDQLIMLHRARAAVHRALDRYLALERPS